MAAAGALPIVMATETPAGFSLESIEGVGRPRLDGGEHVETDLHVRVAGMHVVAILAVLEPSGARA